MRPSSISVRQLLRRRENHEPDKPLKTHPYHPGPFGPALCCAAALTGIAVADTIAHFRFEGTPGEAITTLADVSPNANSGDLAGGTAVYGNSVSVSILDPGALQNTSSGTLTAAYFADNDPVESPLAVEPFLDFTIEGFVNFGGTLEGVESIVGMTESASGAEAFRDGFFLNKFFGNQFRVEAATVGGDYLVVESPGGAAQVNTWYHVAVVGDSTAGTLTLYVDYEIVGSTGGFDGLYVPAPAAGSVWLVGASSINDGQIVDQLSGMLDEVRFSNTALLPADFLTISAADTDGDGLIDFWELENFRETPEETTQEILDKYGSEDDPDGDLVPNFEEFDAGSDPLNIASVPGDIDGDGLLDLDEDFFFGNNDGFIDPEDLVQGFDDDLDQDYSSNGEEIAVGTAPDDAADWPDDDEDNMPDGWEAAYGLDTTSDDSMVDSDVDGSLNIDEFIAGSRPNDDQFTPNRAVLSHRWSFNNSLEDSVGGSDAVLIDPDVDPATGGGATLGPEGVTLAGGTRATSTYVSLGSELLSSLQSPYPTPVTIEAWATQNQIQNWGRIFAFGTDSGAAAPVDGSLFMTWTVGGDIEDDRVGWAGRLETNDGLNAPYLLDVPFHIVMTITPAVFTDGILFTGVEVTFHASPASNTLPNGHPLFDFKGSFVVAAAGLNTLLDEVAYLGRSMWNGDNTASATYDEFRIWEGVLSETERELFHLLGPDNIDRTDFEPDGFPDQWELARFNSLEIATIGGDADGDGENDEDELANESNPANPASFNDNVDGDTLEDFGTELFYFNNLLRDGSGDYDGDQVSDIDEIENFTDPIDPDSSPDLDDDDLPDGWEFTFFKNTDDEMGSTNADGDFDDNLTEYTNGTDPNDRFSGSSNDGDAVNDFWEVFYFRESEAETIEEILQKFDDEGDPDNDMVTNFEEFQAGSNPTNPASVPGDLNGDGVPDVLLEFPLDFVMDDFDSYADTTFVAATGGVNTLVDDGNGGNALQYTATAGGGFLASGFDWVPVIQPGASGPNTNTDLADYVLTFDVTFTSTYVPPTIEVWVKDQAEDPLEFALRSANLYSVASPAMGVKQSVIIPLANPPNTEPFGYEAGQFTPTIDEWRIRINALDGASPAATQFSFTIDNFSVRTVEGEGGNYSNWELANGLTPGVNTGSEENPDFDDFENVLEYQLGGDPLVFDELLSSTDDGTELVFTFERYDLSEDDSTLSFTWSTDLNIWNTVPIGDVSADADANGVVVDITEDGGSSPDYDLIEVRLPKSNEEDGRLFGRLNGTQP